MDKKQWHPAFCGATEWELRENRNDLIFQSEYNLSKNPLKMDLLIIKKTSTSQIKNEIGKIFREHNIVEYKGVGDRLNIDTFFKVIGYACLYKALGEHVNEIAAENITVTFIRHAFPKKLFETLPKMGISYLERYPGIYYLEGATLFPIQIIVTKTVDSAKHSSLKILTNNAKEEDVRQFLIDTQNVQEQGDRNNIDAILQVSVTANKAVYDSVKGEGNMCEALRDLMKDEIEEEIAKATEQVTEKVTEQVTEKVTGEVQTGERLNSIKRVMEGFGVTADVAIDKLGLDPLIYGKYFNL